MLMLLAATMLSVQAPEPEGASIPRPVITRPNWVARPSGQDLAAVYPRAAKRARLGGRATLACTVTAQGVLVDCTAKDETPPGAGFGEAALKLAPKFRMSGHSGPGPFKGGKVRIPITFRVG